MSDEQAPTDGQVHPEGAWPEATRVSRRTRTQHPTRARADPGERTERMVASTSYRPRPPEPVRASRSSPAEAPSPVEQPGPEPRPTRRGVLGMGAVLALCAGAVVLAVVALVALLTMTG